MLPRLLNSRIALSRVLSRPMSSFGNACPLTITPAQLRSLIPAKPSSVAILDASWHMPNTPRNARADWLAMRIPGAQYLDLDAVASPHELGLKHMIPSPEVFAEACENFGITPESHVVIYDTHGIFSSSRALYMFRAFGHNRSSILDGGLPAWIAHGCPTHTGEPEPVEKSTYPLPKLNERVVKSYEQVVAGSKLDPRSVSSADVILDARARGRWLGEAPEPRPGLSSGHIPHSFSLPFAAFLDTKPLHPSRTALPISASEGVHALGAHPPSPSGASDSKSTTPASEASAATKEQAVEFPIPLPQTYTTLKSSTALHAALEDALGPDLAMQVGQGKKGVVASCGSGMTAGILWLGLQAMGVEGSIYDESWTGYAMRPESKIAKGDE